MAPSKKVGVTAETERLHPDSKKKKGRKQIMTYKEFHDLLKGMLTESQIGIVQNVALQNYEDAHGHKAMSKGEKMLAYEFMVDFLRDMDVTECVGYLKPLGIPLITAIRLWEGLE